ncbi:hypothetical protein E2C01_015893 [Portunus trituberculatus]|uniref:Uncharacterized protein n=1 Tax=Portunus trituberculatus TaxID=210409 RepID=A0A5B7DPL9_PORTR|nr:hypothetical protein [Portunus trituberculatus]
MCPSTERIEIVKSVVINHAVVNKTASPRTKAGQDINSRLWMCSYECYLLQQRKVAVGVELVKDGGARQDTKLTSLHVKSPHSMN